MSYSRANEAAAAVDDPIESRSMGSGYCNLRSWQQERHKAGAWGPAGGASLSFRCFAGELLVYNPLSGHTHYLDIVSAQALSLVTAGVGDTSAICSEVAAFLGVDSDDHVAGLVLETLQKLEAVKLIERDAE